MTLASSATGAHVSVDTDGLTPDLYIQAANGIWYPAFAVRDRVIDRVFVTTYFAHVGGRGVPVTAERVATLRAEGRVANPGDFVVTVEATPPRPAPAPDRAPSRRLRTLDESGTTRREKMRRLLNARCGQWEGHTGEEADDMRHAAARFVSEGRTESSMDLSESEMEDACTYVEHCLDGAGFDLDAADEAYRARRAARLAA